MGSKFTFKFKLEIEAQAQDVQVVRKISHVHLNSEDLVFTWKPKNFTYKVRYHAH